MSDIRYCVGWKNNNVASLSYGPDHQCNEVSCFVGCVHVTVFMHKLTISQYGTITSMHSLLLNPLHPGFDPQQRL